MLDKLKQDITEALLDYESCESKRQSKINKHALAFLRDMEVKHNKTISDMGWPKFRFKDVVADMGLSFSVLEPETLDEVLHASKNKVSDK